MSWCGLWSVEEGERLKTRYVGDQTEIEKEVEAEAEAKATSFVLGWRASVCIEYVMRVLPPRRMEICWDWDATVWLNATGQA